MMGPYVLDTNILVHYLKEEKPVVQTVNEWLERSIPRIISTITEAELLAWHNLRASDIELIKDILKTTFIVSVDSSIAHMGAMFRRQYGTPLTDALIAATAFLQNATLVTRNTKDFTKIREIEVLKI